MVGDYVPFDLRMRRILFPTCNRVSSNARYYSVEDTHTSHHLHLGNAMAISENDTDLRWRRALSS